MEEELRIRLASVLLRILPGDKSDKRVVLVDMDGTLCDGESWNVLQMHEATPRQEVINIVNDIYGKRNYKVVVWTARGNVAKSRLEFEMIYWTTYWWLKKNGVRFHELDITKRGYTFQIDDKTVNLTHL